MTQAQKAIDAALEGRWEDALKFNKQILKLEPQNVDALNRLARAHFELGKMNLAKKYYSLALKADPYNPIATKNLKIVSVFKNKKTGKNNIQQNGNSGQKISPLLFLEEPGKTKVATLLRVAEPQKLSLSFSGMPVFFSIKNRKIHVLAPDNNYLGSLPDDLSHHLIRLIKGGNKFDACIKSVKINGLSILIRETFRSKRFKNQPSFLDNFTLSSTDLITPLIPAVTPYEETEEDTPQD